MKLYTKISMLVLAFLVNNQGANAQNDVIPLPQIPKDYGSPTIEISGSAFDLKKNWVVPTRGSGITEMGAWISPNAAGYTILAAFIFELNGKALEHNYEKALKSLIELSYKNLPNDVGQLFSFTYNYSDLGITDVNSIRFTTMGVGATQEQSLAFGPIDQISQGYSDNAVFPNKSIHYVWIYKKDDGSLTLSTIKEPFIGHLKAKALEIKIKMLEEPTSIPIYTDKNIKSFAVAEKWINQTSKYKQELEKRKRFDEVDALNDELKRKQKDFNDLQQTYQEALLQSRKLGTLIQFIDVCQSVTSLLSKKNSGIQSNEKAAYSFEMTYFDNYIKLLNKKINTLSTDINKSVKRLEKIFKESNLPLPLP